MHLYTCRVIVLGRQTRIGGHRICDGREQRWKAPGSGCGGNVAEGSKQLEDYVLWKSDSSRKGRMLGFFSLLDCGFQRSVLPRHLCFHYVPVLSPVLISRDLTRQWEVHDDNAKAWSRVKNVLKQYAASDGELAMADEILDMPFEQLTLTTIS